MKAIIKFLKGMFSGYTGSTGPEGGGYECQCKSHEHNGKFGPG